ncbi:MAG: hypothetical protein P4N59_07460 [Negativicutes bacterium]|nr:hypothetical protein [Negativicutes bacterium]
MAGGFAQVPEYQRQVEPQTNISPQPASVSPAAFGTDVAQASQQVAGGMQNLGRVVADHAIQLQVLKDQSDVLSSDTTFRQQAQDVVEGLKNNQGWNAQGNTKNFDTQVNQLRQQYIDSLSGPMQKNELNRLSQDWAGRLRMDVVDHEATQLRSARIGDLNTNSEQTVSDYLKNPTPEAFAGMQQSFTAKMPFIQSILGLNTAQATEYVQKHTSAAAYAAAKLYQSQGNLPAIQSLLQTAGDKINGQTLDEIKGMVEPLKNQNTVYSSVMPLANDSSMKNPDGTLNFEKMKAVVDKQFGMGATQPNNTYQSLKQAIFGQESGDYTQGANKFGAAGAYQMTPATWQSGLKALGLPLDTPQQGAPPELQDKVADALLKPLYDKYGPKGAAVAWYAGGQNAPRVLAGQNPIGENGQEYSADAKQDDGHGNITAPSVNEYTQQVIDRMGKQPVNFNPKVYEEAVALTQKLVTQSDLEHRQTVNAAMSSFDNWIVTNKPTTEDAITQQARSLGLQGPDLFNAVMKGKQMMQMTRLDENMQSQQAVENALADIRTGGISTKQELDAKYGGTIPYAKLILLENSLTKEMKWATPENIEAFNGVVKAQGIIDMTEKSKIYEKINQQVANAIAHNTPVTRADIEGWATEQSQKIKIAGSFGSRTFGYVADVPKGWSIDSAGPVDPNGLRPDKYVNGKFYKTINGVDIEMKP